ncbi:UNVERIFIED_CONTAM: hypothetical protein Sangu_2449700 [Sesamum angustifolium]|uniref:Retrotransposon gag domain-containing protein n=1 Tax=Sesamum angustifolium TaxID=2727405 RepID=A0AAW2KX33_9LAMI
MQIRSRVREVHGVGDALEPQLNWVDQAPPHNLPPPREQSPINGQTVQPREQVPSPHAESRPHGVLPNGCTSHGSICGATPHQSAPSFTLPKSRIVLGSEEEEQRQEEVNSRVSRPKVAQTQEQYPPQSRPPTVPLPSRGVEDPYFAFAVAPPRRSPFSVLSEYDRTGDPQEHLDKFYGKIDWYDLGDAAYCKLFRTTLSERALAWFNQLPAGTISSLEQLTQRLLHHFSMNKRVPKTATFLFTIRQRENESLREYMQ